MTTTVILSLEHIDCPNCGVVFGVSAEFRARRRETHKSFYCPNGHSMSYPQETEAERLGRELRARNDEVARVRAQVDQERARVADRDRQLAHKDRRIGGYKSVVTRTKRKIAAGRCPCCSHQFKDLERHMKTRHPKWEPERAVAALSEK